MSLPRSSLDAYENILNGPAAEATANYFIIGQDGEGSWVVRDNRGLKGGIFCSFSSALQFAREEARLAQCGVVLSTSCLEIGL
jgi:hypothetical protein